MTRDRRHRRTIAGWLLGGVVLVTGCATLPQPETGPAAAPGGTSTRATSPEARHDAVVARNQRFIVYVPDGGDTLPNLARRFLGAEDRQWEIAEFNGISGAVPGRPIVIPLQPLNPKGIWANGYQTVPILTYHRVGPRANRMIVSPDAFEAQLEYLKRNDYHVIRLADLPDFLEGKRPLPKRAVAITFDDGHVSAYQYAFPLLRKYGFPATYFLYTDFLTAKEGLNWTQIREMADSKLIDFQAHSKTHSNLVLKEPSESEQRYRERLDLEIRQPRDLIQRHLSNKVTHYAYPYGDANEAVLDRLARAGGYELGFTVNPGGNAFFAHPLMLRRTMVFGEHDLNSFKATLQVFKETDLR